MKKTYILEDLGCANCAAKMERAINELESVNKATVTFMTRKLVIDANEEKMDDIMKDVAKIIKKIEPDVVIKEK